MPIYTDKNYLKVTASSAETVNKLDVFGDSLLGFLNLADNIITIANTDLECPIAQSFAALFCASSGTKKGLLEAEKYINSAVKHSHIATTREQAIIKSAKLVCSQKKYLAVKILEEVLDEYPTDIITAKWSQLLYFDLGNTAGLLRAPLKVARSHDDNAHLHGMLAFGYEECRLLDKSEQSVNHALKLDHSEPWAHHAMAHICEARNTLEYGVKFMMGVSSTWKGLDSFMITHNWWHICLFLIDLNRASEALELFDKYIWAYNKGCVYVQINAISLLYRIERVGINVGSRWIDIASSAIFNSKDHLSIFFDFQFLYALARAGYCDAPEVAEKIICENHALSKEEKNTAKYLITGVLNLTNKNYSSAANNLRHTFLSLQNIGGSHAQRDLVELFYIDALYSSEKWNDLLEILSKRYLLRSNTNWINNQLTDTYFNLGLIEVME